MELDFIFSKFLRLTQKNLTVTSADLPTRGYYYRISPNPPPQKKKGAKVADFSIFNHLSSSISVACFPYHLVFALGSCMVSRE